MTVTYSKRASGNKKLSENFTVKEFACKDGSDKVIIDTKLVTILQTIRDHFGKTVTITSGYRNPEYNSRIGGAKSSQHCLGTAADIVVEGVSPLEVAQYAEFLLNATGGIGLYGSFTHIDVRLSRARWNNTSGREISVSGFSGYTNKKNNTTESEDEDMIIYNTEKECPVWAQNYIKKAIELGWIKGDEKGRLNLDDTKIWVLVVLLRSQGIMK